MELRTADKRKWLLVAFATGVLAFLVAWIAPVHLTNPDGIGYFSLTRSLLLDFDFLYWNDFGQLHLLPLYWYATPTAHAGNHWMPGTGILWIPFFLAALIQAWVMNLFFPGSADLSGTSPLYFSAVQIGSLFYVLSGLILLARHIPGFISGRNDSMSPGPESTVRISRVVLYALIMVFWGTPLAFYTLRAGSMPHAASFFINSLFLCLWIRYREEFTPWNAVFVGLVAGIMISVRPQEIGMLLLFIPDLFHRFKNILRNLPGFTIGALTGMIPVFMVNKALYGRFFYNIQVGEMDWFSPHLFSFLFSPFHGAVTWSPVFILCIAGFILILRKEPLSGTAFMLIFLFQVYLNAAFPAWWGSGSFGARRLIGCVPVLAVGAATLLSHHKNWIRRTAYLCGAVMTLWSVSLLLTHLSVSSLISFESFPELIHTALYPGKTASGIAFFFQPVGGWDVFLLKLPLAVLATAGLIFFLRGSINIGAGKKWISATFFIYLGIGVLFTCASRNSSIKARTTPVPDGVVDIQKGTRRLRAPIWKGLADMAAANGDNRRALEYYLRIQKVMPDVCDVLDRIIDLEIACGDRKSARKYYDRLMRQRMFPLQKEQYRLKYEK